MKPALPAISSLALKPIAKLTDVEFTDMELLKSFISAREACGLPCLSLLGGKDDRLVYYGANVAFFKR